MGLGVRAAGVAWWVQPVKLNSGVYGGLEVPRQTYYILCEALKCLIYLENKPVLIIGQTK